MEDPIILGFMAGPLISGNSHIRHVERSPTPRLRYESSRNSQEGKGDEKEERNAREEFTYQMTYYIPILLCSLHETP